ncbi:MAG TPA: hypothetical protein VGZ52_08695, partial [Acidimicrobiales bacterium]|jgi:hypothetical protein|nr:hypothetical protein [Acidimicrobiales bacterium]
MSSVAFFPVYPLAVRVVGAVVPGGVSLGAIVVTVACGAASFVLFHRWCRARLNPASSRAALIALAVYPFSWFLYGAAYSDALYLVLVLAAFLLLESDRPVVAGLVGAIATAARPTGVTLVIGLVAVAADRRGLFRRSPGRRFARRDFGVLLSIGGLLAWCAWLGVRFGNPLAFVETEGAPGWNQPPGPHTWLKLGFFHQLSRLPPPEVIAIVLQACLFVGCLCLIPAVVRRFGPGYAIYAAAAALVPAISSGDFLGLGRYLLPAFPVFAVVGVAATARRRWGVPAAGASGCLLVAGTALFASGYLVS